MDWLLDCDIQNHIWSWYLLLPNGWTAAVIDDSQYGSPKKPTQYLASAISSDEIVQAKCYRQTLAEAKYEALSLALTQKVHA